MMNIKRSNELSPTMRATLGYASTSAGIFPGTFPGAFSFNGEDLASFDSFSSFGRGQSNRIE
jgi:hypothetical protein